MIHFIQQMSWKRTEFYMLWPETDTEYWNLYGWLKNILKWILFGFSLSVGHSFSLLNYKTIITETLKEKLETLVQEQSFKLSLIQCSRTIQSIAKQLAWAELKAESSHAPN